MADKKISALGASTTPLAGTEVLPVVQSGSTVQVSVANLTAGRAVSALSTATTGGLKNTSAGSDTENTVHGIYLTDASAKNVIVQLGASGGLSTFVFESGGAGWRRVAGLLTNGNSVVDVGNLVIGTAGKGIDFSANSHAAGMTSELLNWYEEGNYTPTVAATTGSITSSTATAAYTRIGRQVTVTANVTITNAGTGAGTLTITLPFTANGGFSFSGAGRENALTGNMLQANISAGGTVMNVVAYNNVTAIATSAQIRATITYFV